MTPLPRLFGETKHAILPIAKSFRTTVLCFITHILSLFKWRFRPSHAANIVAESLTLDFRLFCSRFQICLGELSLYFIVRLTQ